MSVKHDVEAYMKQFNGSDMSAWPEGRMLLYAAHLQLIEADEDLKFINDEANKIATKVGAIKLRTKT